MKKRIVCENIRSAYNVGNIIRTADALQWGVIIAGYTAPFEHPKVQKTALGAQESVENMHFSHPQEALDRLKQHNCLTIAAEKAKNGIGLDTFAQNGHPQQDLAVIVGNEITGVTQETLDQVDHIIDIPMKGVKESLNVGQAAAIFMRELGKFQ